MNGKVRFQEKFRRDFITRLLNCGSVQDRQTRESIIGELRGNIRDYTRNDNPRTDAANLVNRCLDFEGGIEELVDAVRFHEGHTLPMMNIYRLAKKWT